MTNATLHLVLDDGSLEHADKGMAVVSKGGKARNFLAAGAKKPANHPSLQQPNDSNHLSRLKYAGLLGGREI